MKKLSYLILLLFPLAQLSAEEIYTPSLTEMVYYTHSAYIGKAIPGSKERLFVLRDIMRPDTPMDTFKLANVFGVGFEHRFDEANILNADSVMVLGTPNGKTLNVHWTGFFFLHRGEIHSVYCCQWGPPYEIGPQPGRTWDALKTEVKDTYQRIWDTRKLLKITDSTERNRRLFEWIERYKLDLPNPECYGGGSLPAAPCKWYIVASEVFQTIIDGPIFEDAWRAQQLALSFDLPFNPYAFKCSNPETIGNFKHADFIINTLASPNSSVADRKCAQLFSEALLGLVFLQNEPTTCGDFYTKMFNDALPCGLEFEVEQADPDTIEKIAPIKIDAALLTLQIQKQQEYIKLLLSKLSKTDNPAMLFNLFQALMDPVEYCSRRQLWALNALRKASKFPKTSPKWDKYKLDAFFGRYIQVKPPDTSSQTEYPWVCILDTNCSSFYDTITLLAQLITTDIPIKTPPVIALLINAKPLKIIECKTDRASMKKLNRGEIVMLTAHVPKVVENDFWEIYLKGADDSKSKQKWHTKVVKYSIWR